MLWVKQTVWFRVQKWLLSGQKGEDFGACRGSLRISPSKFPVIAGNLTLVMLLLITMVFLCVIRCWNVSVIAMTGGRGEWVPCECPWTKCLSFSWKVKELVWTLSVVHWSPVLPKPFFLSDPVFFTLAWHRRVSWMSLSQFSLNPGPDGASCSTGALPISPFCIELHFPQQTSVTLCSRPQ